MLMQVESDYAQKIADITTFFKNQEFDKVK